MVPGATCKSLAVIELGTFLCVETILLVSLSFFVGLFYINLSILISNFGIGILRFTFAGEIYCGNSTLVLHVLPREEDSGAHFCGARFPTAYSVKSPLDNIWGSRTSGPTPLHEIVS